MAPSFKRPFQPSITSYFDYRTESDPPLPPSSTSTTAPPLPATIQSSLLNVGMRVRKAVPEGYKTKPAPYHAYPSSNAQHPDSSSNAPTFSGLVPYCGIQKVGGYAPQPVPAVEDLPSLSFDPDQWSLLPSSQESDFSTLSMDSMPTACCTSRDRKRRREDADDEDLGLELQPVSPRSRPVSHTRMPNLNQLRLIALPRSRRKALANVDDVGGMGKESEMIDVLDFEEAPFLRTEDWGEHGEVGGDVRVGFG